MPIRPEYRHLYRGAAWKDTRRRILERAGNRCEACGKPDRGLIYTYTWQSRAQKFGAVKRYHMAWILADGGKEWRDQDGAVCKAPLMRGLPRKVKVNLGVAHLDNNPLNNADENLKALCSWNHLRADDIFHRGTRSTRKDKRRPLLAALQRG